VEHSPLAGAFPLPCPSPLYLHEATLFRQSVKFIIPTSQTNSDLQF
jgi:hypothetical protein